MAAPFCKKMFEDFKAPPPFEAPTFLHQLYSSPLRYLSQRIYWIQSHLRRTPSALPAEHCIRVLCISDTHCHKPSSLPPADLLIHSGDLTNRGDVKEIQEQIDWLKSLDYKYKIVIAGNHGK